MTSRGRRARPPRFTADSVPHASPVVLQQVPPGLSDETEVQIGNERIKIQARDLEKVRNLGTHDFLLRSLSELIFAILKIFIKAPYDIEGCYLPVGGFGLANF